MKHLSVLFLFLLALTGLLSEELDVEGIKLRAEAGNDQSQLVLASMFDQGVGVEQSFGNAFYWAASSAVQGNTLAQMIMGQMYFTGQGMKLDKVAGLAWVMLAFQYGNEYAEVIGDQFVEHMTEEEAEQSLKKLQELMAKLKEKVGEDE